MNILAVGDICGQSGIDILTAKLRVIKKQYDIAFTVVNGENAAGLGIMPKQADAIMEAGADVITLGNHTWSKTEICKYLDDHSFILRPANFSPQVPGKGWNTFDTSFGKVCVINLVGRVEIKDLSENPFLEANRILKTIRSEEFSSEIAQIILVDFHASATSEKNAMAYHLDGKASALWGTHTHVQTSDARIFPKGLGYITDIGMTGPFDSVIGMKPDRPLSKFLGNPSVRFVPAEGDSRIEGAVFEVDVTSGRALSVEAIRVE